MDDFVKMVEATLKDDRDRFFNFLSLVRRMREAQVKRFEFYTDDGWWADRAIELEKEVDEYLKKMEG